MSYSTLPPFRWSLIRGHFVSTVAKRELENPHLPLPHHGHYEVIFRTRRLGKTPGFGNRNSWPFLPRHRSATTLFQMLVAVAVADAGADAVADAGADADADADTAAAAAAVDAAAVAADAADAAAAPAAVEGIELETRLATWQSTP